MFTRAITRSAANLRSRALIFMIALAGQFTSVVRYRGFWHICYLLGRLVRGGRVLCTIRVCNDGEMTIDLSDPYWSRLIASRYAYEPEIYAVLRYLRAIDFCFIDAGANLGFWSILASSAELGTHPVLSVEASSTTFARLSENCALNKSRFRCLNLAIAQETGRMVSFANTDDHAAAHIADDPSTAARDRCEKVLTISLDDLCSQYCRPDCTRFVVKLDLEGHEVSALAGATHLLSKDVLVLYEDHGSDPGCRASQYVLEELGFAVFFMTSNCQLQRTYDVPTVRRAKTRKSVGYNFFGCKESSVFFRPLQQLAEGSPQGWTR